MAKKGNRVQVILWNALSTKQVVSLAPAVISR